MSKKYIRIGFIGAGSIGSLFGGYLADIGSNTYSIEVIFFCMKPHADAINKTGLKIVRNQKIKIIKKIKAYENEKSYNAKLEKDSSFRFDFIFLTTKAYDIKSALLQYEKVVNQSKRLVILQNGIGNEDKVLRYCDKSKIIRALTTNGAFLIKPGCVFHTGEGITKIGFPFISEFNLESQEFKQAESDLNVLKEILSLSGLKTIIVKNIIEECWEKAFVNIGINAIGALTRLPNGILFEVEGLKDIIGKAIKEAIKVAEMKNIKFPKKDYISITHDVTRKTAENRNSMLQDILNGQSTEIKFLNGRILKYAEDLGIKVPINKILTHLILALERSGL
ncbi:MAG: ketopantoate reductase family protein [Promethearchaeota archaeon]